MMKYIGSVPEDGAEVNESVLTAAAAEKEAAAAEKEAAAAEKEAAAAEKEAAAAEKKGAAGMQENKHLIELSKAYKYEDKGEISSIDLSCLENATAEVLIKASKVMTSTGDIMALPENDIRYALFVAAECTGFPYGFYKKLNMQDAIKVKRKVLFFFNGGE